LWKELQSCEVNNSSTTRRVSAPAAAMNPTDKPEASSAERKLCPMLTRPAMEGLNDIPHESNTLTHSCRRVTRAGNPGGGLKKTGHRERFHRRPLCHHFTPHIGHRVISSPLAHA